MQVNELVAAFTDEANYRKLTLCALTLTGNMQDAEDLLGDLLVSIYSDAALQGVREPMPYFKTCLRNAAVNRRARERRVSPVDPVLIEELGVGAESFMRELEERETVSGLRRVLAQYPYELAEAFIKYHLEGYSVKELAQSMGMRPNTLTRRFMRMRADIRKRAPMLWCMLAFAYGMRGAV